MTTRTWQREGRVARGSVLENHDGHLGFGARVKVFDKLDSVIYGTHQHQVEGRLSVVQGALSALSGVMEEMRSQKTVVACSEEAGAWRPLTR